MISVKDFGALGDGVTDDTLCIQNFIDSLPSGETGLFPAGVYCVTHLEWSGSQRNYTFDNARLKGVATGPQESIVTFHNLRHANIENFFCLTDGNEEVPVFMPNYKCAVRFISSSYGGPCQFNNFTGSFKVWYIPNGIVYGNFLGEPPQDPYPQSENFMYNFSVRGVTRPYYSNALNSLITFTNGIFVPQKFEASSWWDSQESTGYCARNDEGVFVSIGGEFQRAIQTGYAIYGKNILISNTVWEVSCSSYITGNVTITDNVNGYFGVSGLPAFIINPAAKGKLRLNNILLEKPLGTAEYDRSRLVDCSGNNDFIVELVDSELKEFSCSSNNGMADLVHNGKVKLRNVKVANSGPAQQNFTLTNEVNKLDNVDPCGISMLNGIQSGGGWTSAEGTQTGAFGKNMSYVPPDCPCYIRVETVGSGYMLSTANPFKVDSGKDYVFESWFRGYGSGSGMSVDIRVYWTDFNNNPISNQSIINMSLADMINYGFTGVWRKARGYVKAPAGAIYCKLKFICGSNTIVGIANPTFCG